MTAAPTIGIEAFAEHREVEGEQAEGECRPEGAGARARDRARGS